jgi:hypothetical protein
VAKLAFSDWWNGFALRISTQNPGSVTRDFTRRSLVLTVANPDGGAHIDPELDSVYFALSRESALGDVSVGGKHVEWDSNPVPCAIRQVAHELLLTLDEQAGAELLQPLV